MKSVLISIAVLFSFLSSQAQQINDDLAKLQSLNAKFIHNFVTNDTVAHSAIIHKSFVYISSEGRTVGRSEYMKDWLHGFDGYTYWDYRNEQISIFGNTALVRSQNKFVVVKEGKEITGMSFYTDTYIKENGEWKCVQAQIGKVTPNNYAGDDTIVKKYDYRKK